MAMAISANVHSERPSTPALREPLPPRVQAPVADPWSTTVLDRFYDTVRANPDAVAVFEPSTASGSPCFLTYSELWNYAAAFRAQLSAQGLAPGEMVGVVAKRSIATIAAMVGVVMAGGCYVPVELEELPAADLHQLTRQTDLRHWVVDADAQLSDSLARKGGSVLSLRDVPRPASGNLAEIPAVAIDANSPLYVMFTSGSTGLPKGVVVPHRAVARLVTGQNFIEFGQQHTFLLHSPLSFDASTLELWASLLHGSRLVVAPARSLSLNDYSNLILDHGVTTLWLTAAMFHLAAEHTPEMFAPLSQLIFGGDVISPRHVERVRELYPALHMTNGYGPTENTTFTCCYIVPKDYRADGNLPIGSPLAYTTVHILDPNRQPVAIGQHGELAAGGAGVALGYLDRPDATAARFIPDPDAPGSDARLYLTGDRVWQRQDGTIEFLGRLDDQIKIAGHRIELGAIESAISSSPLVAEAAIVVLTPSSAEKRLVACVSLSSATEDAEARLREWLLKRVARYAVPQHWIFLSGLPINAHGKLDRNALRSNCESLLMPVLEGRQMVVADPKFPEAGSEELDRTQLVVHVQRLWENLLRRANVDEEENFFDLGGTSLLLIEMHARLAGQFRSVPSLVEMFSFPTPRSLADRLYSGQNLRSELTPAEQRGRRQRAAMLKQRATPLASRTAPQCAGVPTGEEGGR